MPKTRKERSSPTRVLRGYLHKAAQDLACEEMRHGRLNLNHLIAVKDENRQALFTVSFGEAVEIES